MRPYTAAYLRVSGQKQRTTSQRTVIARYVKQHRIKQIRWMQDKKTGRNMRRPQLQRIIEDCRQGTCNRILIYKLDRLARNTRETLNLFQELTDLGVTVVCVTQNLTFDSSAMGKFMLSMFAAVAELESDFTSERIKAGLAVAKNKGGASPDHKKRKRVQRMIDEGMTLQEMSDKLGITRGSIYGMIRRMRAA